MADPLAEKVMAQRAAFREHYGCYPEELIHTVCGRELRDCDCGLDRQAGGAVSPGSVPDAA